MGEVMPLTPEDVSKKRFTPVRLREGYDMGEVDAFLDEVEAELERLLKENDDLRSKLSATDGGTSAIAMPGKAPEKAAEKARRRPPRRLRTRPPRRRRSRRSRPTSLPRPSPPLPQRPPPRRSRSTRRPRRPRQPRDCWSSPPATPTRSSPRRSRRPSRSSELPAPRPSASRRRPSPRPTSSSRKPVPVPRTSTPRSRASVGRCSATSSGRSVASTPRWRTCAGSSGSTAAA